MLKFITHRPLWFNLLVALVLAFIFFLLFMLSLKCLTNHGRSRTVPSIFGKNYNDAEKLLNDAGFEMIIQDSVYVDTMPPLTITRQLPEADAVVKVNRTVYVTINRATAPMVDVSNLIGLSFRNVEMSLESMNINIKDTVHQSDWAGGSVLDILQDGQTVKGGRKIQMGTDVVLVVASGVGESHFNVPDLIGMTYGEAKDRLQATGLNLLVLDARGVSDSSTAFIIDQQPRRMDANGNLIRIRTGQIINVVLSLEKPVVVDTTTTGQIPQN